MTNKQTKAPGEADQQRPFSNKMADLHRTRLHEEKEQAIHKGNPMDILLADAQRHLLNGETSALYRREFFDDAYLNIINDLFKSWLHSSPEEVKKREYLYQVAMALGSVKERLLAYEQFAKNIPGMQASMGKAPQGQNDDEDGEGA